MTQCNHDLICLSAVEATELIKSKAFSVAEYVRACIKQCTEIEQAVHAWAYFAPEQALEHARRLDAKLKQSIPTTSLFGIPVGVKDIFNTADMPTQMGSPIWRGFTPGNDARVVHYLRMADAIFPGKTVTAEFAVHTPGPTANPHNLAHSPGTSSSGSAAAVATYMIPLALGTQTAGSIIRPASYCGILGFKPSFGLIPRTGMLKTTDSLDTVGLFARSVNDLEVGFDVLRVHGDDYPIGNRLLNDGKRQGRGKKHWKIGIVKGPKWKYAEEYARESLYRFADELGELEGLSIEELELPGEFAEAHEIHATIYDRTLAYYFKEEFKNHTLISPLMYSIIERGNRITLDQYKLALDRQRDLARQLDELLEQRFDVILTLSTGGEAPRNDQEDRPDTCLIWTLCGAPSINLPVFAGPNGLPYGAQIVARRYSDYLLIEFAKLLTSCSRVANGVHPTPQLELLRTTGNAY